MILKVECLERYPYDITGLAWRNSDEVTTAQKLESRIGLDSKIRLKGLSVGVML